MALFFHDDADMSHRLTGFDRYRQLMSFYAFRWMKVNLITVIGALPLAAGIAYSILASSLVTLVPLSLLGGAIFGPFLAGMYDAIMRGLRDAPGKWTEHYKKSWKQNWKSSLLPGAIFGFMVGMFAFMFHIMYSAQVSPGFTTVALYAFSGMLFLLVTTLYWPQLVLFSQTNANRLRNITLFTIRHFWRVLLAVILKLGYVFIYILLAPWTIVLIPFVGFWFTIFVTEFILYSYLNEDLKIEEQFIELEGDPWAEDSFAESPEE